MVDNAEEMTVAARHPGAENPRGWRVGCNFNPSTASNQLEMWQGETFDPATLERELGWARDLGLTSMRVFLHDLLWRDDSEGLLRRMDEYLALADACGIGTLFVLFDGVWNPQPMSGPQPEPRPFLHNSRWVQSPGAAILGDAARHDELRPYVQGVVDRFRDDPRVDGWDLFNEPDGPNLMYHDTELTDKAERAAELLGKSFAWAREAAPSQPLTTGIWLGDWSDPAAMRPIETLSLANSDIVSFHHYGALDDLEKRISELRRYEKPIWCTEFMARGAGSFFDPHLGLLKDEGVGAWCWGFVAGKTQTNFPWDSWLKEYSAEPDLWFHEILRADGTPWNPAETEYIRALTARE